MPTVAEKHGQLLGLPVPAGSTDAQQASGTSGTYRVAGTPLQTYGRYVLIDRLGKGGMAEVFRALAIGPALFRRQVVVKRILPQLSEDPRFIRMFMDEATVCGRLQHPNVIQVHDFGKEDETFFLVMEYVHGRNLDKLIGRLARERRTLPPDLVAEIGRQACLGLHYAHTLTEPGGKPLNIVHRDVSPSNVMVAYSGAVKVLDFGIADIAAHIRFSEVTDTGQLKGKSAYLAPEQYRRAEIDARADIFSLGIVLHEALTSRRLFRKSDPLQAAALVLEMEIPRPSRLNRAVPPPLDAIVMRALERDRDRRFASAAEMAELLENFLVERRFASQALPRFMADTFKDEVAEPPLPDDAEIQAALDQARANTPLVTQSTRLGPPPLPLGDAVVVIEDTAFAAAAAVPVASMGIEHSRRARLAMRVGMGSVAVGLLAVGGAAFLLMGGPPPSAPVPAPAHAPMRQVATLPAPLPGRVDLAVNSQPPGAQVERLPGGDKLGPAPLSFSEPRGSEPIRLRVTSPGYVPATVEIVPDQDRSVLVTLAGEPKPRASMRRPRAPGKAPPGPQAPVQGKVRHGIPIDPFK